ncbi:transcription antitermination factor NusB [Candidatus Poribacteria bacterium]|nr:transcription antitermination factor NusB [Candidatus Poribacteria bacterium]
MRSEARSFALQMLYQAAVYPNLTAEQIQKQYWQQSFFIDPDLYVPIHLFRRLFWTPARSQYSPQATRRHRQDQVIEIEKYWVSKQAPKFAEEELIELFQRLYWDRSVNNASVVEGIDPTIENPDQFTEEVHISVESIDDDDVVVIDSADTSTQNFANLILVGTLKNLVQIDDTIQSALTDWNLRRLHIADLSILRAGSYEMLYLEDIPPIVSINEAIELAKKFGSEDSPRFVNGILDQIKKNCLDPSDLNF